MRGKVAIYEFLRAHRPLSEAQEYLPHPGVQRADLVGVCIELNEQLDKANEQLAAAKEKLAQKQDGEASAVASVEQATGASLTVEVTYKTFPSTLYPTRWKLAAFKVGPGRLEKTTNY